MFIYLNVIKTTTKCIRAFTKFYSTIYSFYILNFISPTYKFIDPLLTWLIYTDTKRIRQ